MPPERRYGFVKPGLIRLFGALDAAGFALTAPGRRRAPWPAPRRVLLVNLAHIGDLLLTTPAITALRVAHPQAHLTLLAAPWSAAVVDGNPRLDEVQVYRPAWWDRARGSPYLVPGEFAALVRLIRAGRYDLVINFKSFFQENLAAAAAGVPRRLGYGLYGGGFLHTECLPFPWDTHTVHQHLRLAQAAGADPASAPPAEIYPSAADEHAAQALLAEAPAGRPVAALHLGAGTPAKLWPVARYAALGDHLVDTHGAVIVLVGGAEDAPLVAAYRAHARHIPRVAAGAFSLRETAALLRRCAVFVGNDSGPAHLAAAGDTPTIVIFSGTNEPEQWKPWGRRVTVLQERPVCAPCGRTTCHLDHACLTRITMECVSAALAPYLPRFSE